MKKSGLAIVVLFICLVSAAARIEGGFYYVQDLYGNVSIVFKGKNTSGRPLRNLKIRCINDVLKQHKDLTIRSLPEGNLFEVGLAEGWQWLSGEKLRVTYDDGHTATWIYAPVPAAGPVAPAPEPAGEAYLKTRIRQLRYKLKEARRSLRLYERMNDKNPSVSGGMLVTEQYRLVRTYENQLYELERQLYRYP